jgi:GTP-binding protein
MTEVDPFRVRDARFLRSAPSVATCGETFGPEIAFVGRSNVGKSSLLGELLGRPKLVKTSRTPGRTRLVNLFDVDLKRVEPDGSEREARLTFADLPGYGYAKVSLDERARLGDLISEYLEEREPIVAVVQLFDLRHAPTDEDRSVLQMLQRERYAHIVVATKADKLPLAKRKGAAKKLGVYLGLDVDGVTLFSVDQHKGRAALWSRIFEALP